MVGFLPLLALQIGVIIFLRLITPKAKRPKAAPFEGPIAEDGAPIPRPFGIQQISGSIMLVKDKKIVESNDGAVHTYSARMALALGWGPFDVLYEILFDQLALSLQLPGRNQSAGGREPITTMPFPIPLTGDDPVKFNIAALSMFGGGAEEGGVNGEVCIYRGTDAQPLDPLVEYAYGTDFASRYPHQAYIRFGTAPDEVTTSMQGSQFYWIANNPTPKPVSVIVGAYPRGLLDQAIALGITTYTDPRIGQDANPMEVIYECLVNKVWGKRESPAIFNIPQLIAKAEQLRRENRGISTTFVNQMLDDFIDDVERHIRGALVENPKTGLVEMQLLRPDYTPDTLTVLTKKNTLTFHQREGHFLETLNQLEVKYRRFDGGTAGVFNDVLVTDDLQFPHTNPYPLWVVYTDVYVWQSGGSRLINVTATRTRSAVTVPLVEGTDFRYASDSGEFAFFNTATLQEGDEVHVSYESAPISSGFADASVSAQNLANFQVTGINRAESYDYTMFTREVVAQEMADFLKLVSARKLPIYTWTMNREGSHLRTGDVVLVNEPAFRCVNVPIRITNVGYGTLEKPQLRFEGIKDVFAEQVGLRSPTPAQAIPSPTTLLPITATVLVTCLGGASRVGLFSTDPALTIKLWRADDAIGTGAVLIATLPGDTRYYDDPQTVGVTKFYAAQLSGFGYADTALTPWGGCTAAATPPDEPADVLPTWELVTSDDGLVGTATLDVLDPQLRVLSVEWKTKSGYGLETAYVPFAGEPYTATVDLVSGAASTATFRITYLDLDMTEVSEEVVALFDLPTSLPPVPTARDATSGIIPLPFHTTLTHGAVFRYPPVGKVELAEYGRRWIDLTGCSKVLGQMHVNHALPGGAAVLWEFVPDNKVSPFEDDWQNLAKYDALSLAADVVSDTPTHTIWTPLATEAKQGVFVRAVIQGGDGATQFSTRQMLLMFKGDVETTGEEGPATDPCQDVTDGFGGYQDQAAMDAVFLLNDLNGDPPYDDQNLLIEWKLDLTGGIGGSRCLKATAHETYRPGSVWASNKYRKITGLVPGAFYKTRGSIKTDWVVGLVENIFGEHPSPFVFVINTDSFLAGTAETAVPSAAAFGAFEEVETLQQAANGSGEIWIGCGVTNGYFITVGHLNAWFDNLTLIKVSDGSIAGSCSGGPTIPGDGGYEPPGDLPPALPPPDTGLRSISLWHLPAPYTQYAPIYGTVKLVTPANIISTLNAIRAAGRKVILSLVGGGEPSRVNGVWNVDKYLQTLEGFVGIDISGYTDIITGIMVIDEPYCARCKGLTEPIQWDVVDGRLGKRTAQIFPGFLLFVRESAVRIQRRGAVPQYIRGAWCQWTGPGGGIDGQPTVEQYMLANKAAADALHMQIMWGINVADYAPEARNITATELQHDLVQMALDHLAHGVSLWAGLTVSGYDPTFLQTAPYVTALNAGVAAM